MPSGPTCSRAVIKGAGRNRRHDAISGLPCRRIAISGSREASNSLPCESMARPIECSANRHVHAARNVAEVPMHQSPARLKSRNRGHATGKTARIPMRSSLTNVMRICQGHVPAHPQRRSDRFPAAVELCRVAHSSNSCSILIIGTATRLHGAIDLRFSDPAADCRKLAEKRSSAACAAAHSQMTSRKP